MWTVFSSASYPGGQGDNKGAILRLVPGEAPSPISYALEGDDLAGEHAVRDGDGGGRDGDGGGRDGGSLFQNLAALILAHKQRLFEAFEIMEAAGDLKRVGRASVAQWAAVMERELELNLDWRALRPLLADTVRRAVRRQD